MNPAEAIVLLIAIALGTAAISALIAALNALFPRVVERTRQFADANPRRSFVVGLVNAVFLSALVLALGALAERVPLFFALPAILAMFSLACGLSFGATAVAKLAGSRMWPGRPAMQQTAFGAMLLTLGCLVPIVGWFGLLPYVFALGLGAFILGLLAKPDSTA